MKSIGTLYYLGAIILALALVAYAIPFLSLVRFGGMGAYEISMLLGGGLLIFGLVVLQWKLANGLRNLRPWVRIPIIVLSVIGLIGFPLGTLISAYILYLMLAAKSKMIFSQEYQQIIAATPHLRYRSSLLKTVLFLILIVAALMSVAYWAKLNP